MPSLANDLVWLEALSPWPEDGFGLERMQALTERLGHPERTFEAVHVVGTKGKSTAARRIAATIGGRAYTSPHVEGWHERLQTDPAGLAAAIARVRADAEAVRATQFETLLAALPERLRPFVLLLYTTGVRTGEARKILQSLL